MTFQSTSNVLWPTSMTDDHRSRRQSRDIRAPKKSICGTKRASCRTKMSWEAARSLPLSRRLALDESQQVGVDRVRVRGWHSVREIFICLESGVLQQFCRQGRGISVGNDLIILAMHYQNWHGDLLEVLCEIGL